MPQCTLCSLFVCVELNFISLAAVHFYCLPFLLGRFWVWSGMAWLVWVELAEFWYVKAWFGGPWTFGFACAATPLNSRFRFTRFEFPLQAATTTASELPESDCCWPSCSSCCLGYCARFCWHRCYYFDSATRTHTHAHTHKDPGRHPAPSLI